MKTLNAVALTLVIVGAINWGLVGLARIDLVAMVAGLEFGQTNTVTNVIYILVGLAGLWSFAIYPYLSRSHTSHMAAR